MERGVPIRAITRGIAVLSAVNRDGPITMMNISKSANIPYPTACRIVQTFLHEGLIEREPARKRYRVTSLVQTLATGFQSEDQLVAVARPHLEELCRKFSWPVSLATRVGTRMMVLDSTHKMTSLTFTNYYPGYTLPIAECATGKSYLAHCSDEERQTIVEAWKATDNETSKMGLLLVSDDVVLNKIREDGYAHQMRNFYNEEPGKTSSLAVPVNGPDGDILGSLAIIYFASALKADEATATFLKAMQETASQITESLEKSGSSAD
ncbi:IclR family transcriptional regulator domain-containing protein [Parasphingorhabdus cellanae]|uniref:Helix-turn-helix domain-containing protein n=1 Tax=Parasphingorhabdus cellanae TaxID=2806553 RepID=A0ABX7T9X8_9SPHN|nr:IclR family transcriptional regulator C-terminal domain-containing protein [Parasphingorhabdus cellanae]QTD57422.1 helix-turn-helix domain-containing protein [Parasphingorhabdus cellanae]